MSECQHRYLQAWHFTDNGEPADFWSCNDCGLKFRPMSEIITLEATIAELRKDAERYETVKRLRWDTLQAIKTRTALALHAGGDTFDNAIDAAKEQGK